jgi:hypothetical protein
VYARGLEGSGCWGWWVMQPEAACGGREDVERMCIAKRVRKAAIATFAATRAVGQLENITKHNAGGVRAEAAAARLSLHTRAGGKWPGGRAAPHLVLRE